MKPTEAEILDLLERVRQYTMDQWVYNGDTKGAALETELSTMIYRIEGDKREEGSDESKEKL